MLVLPLTLWFAANLPDRVVSLADEVAVLGRKLGKNLSVDPGLRLQHVYVSDPGAPPEQITRALAATFHASWVTTPQGVVLKRTPSDQKAITDAEVAEREDWLKRRLDAVQSFRNQVFANGAAEGAIADEIKHEADATQAFVEHRAPSPDDYFASLLLPSEQLLESLVSKIGLPALADLPSGHDRIYEDFPVDLAQELPAHDDSINQYLAASRALSAASGLQSVHLGPYQAWLPPYLSQIGKPVSAPVKLWLQETSSRDRILLNLRGFDANGAEVSRATLYTIKGATDLGPNSVVAEDIQKPDARWITPSQGALALLKSRVAPGYRVPDVQSAWLLHPEQNEPLNLFVGEVLAEVAATNPTRPAVMEVDDDFWRLTVMCFKKDRVCLTAFLDLLDDVEDYEQIDSDGTTIWRPRMPEATEESTADRSALGTFARSVAAGDTDPLRDVSVLYRTASPQDARLAEVWITNMNPDFATDGNFGLDGRVYRLLRAISDPDWDTLSQGGSLSADQLSVTGPLRDLLTADPLIPTGKPTPTDLKKHALELFATTALGDARIAIPSFTQDVVRTKLQGQDEQPVWLSTDYLKHLVLVRFARPTRDSFTITSTQDSYEKDIGDRASIRLGTEHDRRITLLLPENLRIELAYRGNVTDVRGPMLYADLPQALRDHIWRSALADMIRFLSSAHTGAPAGTNPAPVIHP